jgi:hypothetical protein
MWAVKQTILNRAKILQGIGVEVAYTVLSAPGLDGIFDGTTNKSSLP